MTQVDFRRARTQQRPLTPSSTLDRPHPRAQLRELDTKRSSWVDASPWSSPPSSPSSTNVILPFDRRAHHPIPTPSRFSKLRDSIIPQSVFFSDKDFDMVWRELEGESVPVLIKRERWRNVLGRKDVPIKNKFDDAHSQLDQRPREHHPTCKHHLHAKGITGANPAHAHQHSHSHAGNQEQQAAYSAPLNSRKPAAVSKVTSYLSAVIYKAIFWKSRDPVNRNASGKRKHQFPRPWTKVDPVRRCYELGADDRTLLDSRVQELANLILQSTRLRISRVDTVTGDSVTLTERLAIGIIHR